MKHTKRTKFLANMTTASNNPVVNPIPTLTAIKDILDRMPQAPYTLPAEGQWTLFSPDGRFWIGTDPLAIAAQAQPLSTELRNSK